jgi:ABC-type phosphate transport system permease subunit
METPVPRPIVPLLLGSKIFEHRKQGLASRQAFFSRVMFFLISALALTMLFVFIGMLGYRYFVEVSWLDAFVNASLTLAGMGGIDIARSLAGKIFTSIYSLFCGLVFSIIISMMFAPFVHRIYHKFHLDNND